MKALLALLLLIPLAAIAKPIILINAVPSGGVLIDYAEIRPPFGDMRSVDPKIVVSVLSSALHDIMATAEQRGVTHVCLFSAAGSDGVEFAIPGVSRLLRLPPQKTVFDVVFYRQDAGTNPGSDFAYSLEEPDAAIAHTHISINKISVPQGYTTAAWIYFNLPRIQLAAAKDGASKIFVKFSGQGRESEVILPGSSISVPETGTVMEATWYMAVPAKAQKGESVIETIRVGPGTNASP